MNIRRIVRWKIYLDRARLYVGYIQFFATLFIVVKLLRNGPVKTWIFDNWYLSFPALFVLFIGGCIVLGWLESLLKIRDYEQENYTKVNPEWQKLMDKLDEINDKLNILK